MDLQLRVIFLIVGLLILLGVAIDVFRRRSLKRDEFDNQLLRPMAIEIDSGLDSDLDENIDPDLDSYHEQDDTGSIAKLNLDLDLEPEFLPIKDVISIFIIPRDPAGFRGGDLHSALNNANFHIGKNKVFYRYEQDNGDGEPLFSLAKAIEPGYFEVDNLIYELIPGVTLIMLPSKLKNPILALDKLIRAAKQISFVLNGQLLDHTREALTLTTIDKYKEQLKAN